MSDTDKQRLFCAHPDATIQWDGSLICKHCLDERAKMESEIKRLHEFYQGQRWEMERRERKAFEAGWSNCHDGILGVGSIDCREAYRAFKEENDHRN